MYWTVTSAKLPAPGFGVLVWASVELPTCSDTVYGESGSTSELPTLSVSVYVPGLRTSVRAWTM